MANNRASADHLLSMAERCEAATWADRELEVAIAHELGWRKHPNPTSMGGLIDAWYNPAGEQVRWAVPLYTASLDAAVTLVPEGCFARIYGEGAQGIIVRPFSGAYLEVARGFAATPALALCAAALRARAEVARLNEVAA